jgi:catechol 2,3-dioxygenase-like lactoylglutathione lyase family enzyme
MIIGVHAIMFSPDAERLRDFLRDVLELPSVDAGDGWPIFALPPAELAAHPTEGEGGHTLYLMCDDLRATLEELRARGVEASQPVTEQAFGLLSAIRLPDGTQLGLYEPHHQTALRDTR